MTTACLSGGKTMLKILILIFIILPTYACNTDAKFLINECFSNTKSNNTSYIEKIVGINEREMSYKVVMYVNGRWESKFRSTSFKYAHDSNEYFQISCPK
jgi:hypothetical protein